MYSVAASAYRERMTYRRQQRPTELYTTRVGLLWLDALHRRRVLPLLRR